MKGVWQPLLKRPDQTVVETPIEEIVEEIVNLGQQIGTDLEKDDLKEGLGF